MDYLRAIDTNIIFYIYIFQFLQLTIINFIDLARCFLKKKKNECLPLFIVAISVSLCIKTFHSFFQCTHPTSYARM